MILINSLSVPINFQPKSKFSLKFGTIFWVLLHKIKNMNLIMTKKIAHNYIAKWGNKTKKKMTKNLKENARPIEWIEKKRIRTSKILSKD